MKKKIFALLLLAFTLLSVFSACTDKSDDDSDDPFYDPNAGKDQISYIFAIKEPTGQTRQTIVSSDKNVTLGAALEALGYVTSENEKFIKVFNYSLEQFQVAGYDLSWELSINGTVTNKSPYEIIPEKNTVYSVEMSYTVSSAPAV